MKRRTESAVSEYILENKLVQPQKLMQAKLITNDSDNLIYEVLYDLNLLTVDELNEVLSAVTGSSIDPLFEINRVNVPEEVPNPCQTIWFWNTLYSHFGYRWLLACCHVKSHRQQTG